MERLSSIVRVRRRSELAEVAIARRRSTASTASIARVGSFGSWIAGRIERPEYDAFTRKMKEFDDKITAYCAIESDSFLPKFKKECLADDLIFDWGSFYRKWKDDHGDCTLCTIPTVDDYNNKWVNGLENLQNRFKAMTKMSGAAKKLGELPSDFGAPLPPPEKGESSSTETTDATEPSATERTESQTPIATAGASSTTFLVLVVATIAAIGGYFLLSKGPV